MATRVSSALHRFMVTTDHPPKFAVSKFIGIHQKEGFRVSFNVYVPGRDRVEVGLRLKAWMEAEGVHVRGVVFAGPMERNGVTPEDALLAISKEDIEEAIQIGTVLVGAFMPWEVADGLRSS